MNKTYNREKKHLHYPGTDIAIKLGDRIQYRKIFGGKFLLFGKFQGVVVYVPGESPKNTEMEYEGARFWAIQLDGEKSQIVFPYFPEDEWVSKRIKFIRRGKPVYDAIKPGDQIWGDQCEDENSQ